MIVCKEDGSYKAMVGDSQKGRSIECVVALEDGGFLLALENSFIVYRNSTGDPRAPLRVVGERTQIVMAGSDPNMQISSIKIASMALNEAEDTVYIVTKQLQDNNKNQSYYTNQGQLLRGQINTADFKKQAIETKFNYVHAPYHKDYITGLDVCVRKQLVVTCSKDKTVHIWNYDTCQQEITHTFNDACLSVAFHPSGLHLLVATQDKVNMCNILSNQLNNFHQLQIQKCGEIKFAHGGHLFACVYDTKKIHVYNWYTADRNPLFSFDGHPQKIKCIDWFDNDLGFSTCAEDGAVFFWDLYNYTGLGNKKPGDELTRQQD